MHFELKIHITSMAMLMAVGQALNAIDADGSELEVTASPDIGHNPFTANEPNPFGQQGQNPFNLSAAALGQTPNAGASPGMGATVTPSLNTAPVHTAVSTTPAGAAELDDEGMPWDARIHGKEKKKLVKGGGWKLIKGVDKGLVAQVIAEHKAQGYPRKHAAAANAPATPGGFATNPQPVQGAGTFAAPIQGTVSFNPGGFNPAATTIPQVQESPAKLLNDKILAAVANEDITGETITALLNHYGVPGLLELGNFPDRIAAIDANLDQILASAQ